MEATDDIKRGETISITYGDGPNSQFFKNYGFVLDGNEQFDIVNLFIKNFVDP